VEFDQHQQQEEHDSAPAFESERRPSIVPRMEVTAAAGRELDDLEGAVFGQGGEFFGRQGPGGTEMTK